MQIYTICIMAISRSAMQFEQLFGLVLTGNVLQHNFPIIITTSTGPDFANGKLFIWDRSGV